MYIYVYIYIYILCIMICIHTHTIILLFRGFGRYDWDAPGPLRNWFLPPSYKGGVTEIRTAGMRIRDVVTDFTTKKDLLPAKKSYFSLPVSLSLSCSLSLSLMSGMCEQHARKVWSRARWLRGGEGQSHAWLSWGGPVTVSTWSWNP